MWRALAVWSLLAYAACRGGASPVELPDPSALLSAPPPGPITIAFVGQSNCNQAGAPDVGTVIPVEATVWHNGAKLTAYPSPLYGPQANMIEALIVGGYTSVYVVSDCTNGRAIAALISIGVPNLIATVDAAMLDDPAMPPPSVLVLVHGEQDGALEGTAQVYYDRLMGPRPDLSTPPLIPLIWEQWGPIDVLITEVRTRGTNLYSYTHWTRAAQHWAARFEGVCLVPTGGPDWDGDCALRGPTNPHYSTDGLRCLGTRIADNLLAGECL